MLFISAAAALFAGTLLMMTRFWGLAQPYQAFEHPFLQAPPFPAMVKIHRPEQVQAVIDRQKDAIFWLDLYMTKDGHFLVLPESPALQLKAETLKEKFLSDKTYFYDLSFLRLYFDQATLLEDFLSITKNRLILNIKDNALNVHTQLMTAVEKAAAQERVLIQSDIERVIKTFKESRPLWLYGTSHSDLMRLLSFDSVGIVASSPFVGDVFIAPMKLLNRPAFNENVLQEIHRRKKTVFLGPLKDVSEVNTARGLQADGFIYENPELFLHQLD